MLISRTFRWVVLLTLAATVGCATSPKGGAPTPPVSSSVEKARQAVAEAQASGYQVEDALIFLRQAEQAAAGGDTRKADALSLQTVQAVRARRAIEDAKPVIARAKAADALHGDADKLLEAAEAALRAGDPARAEELAGQVRRQAENALEQKHSSHRVGDAGLIGIVSPPATACGRSPQSRVSMAIPTAGPCFLKPIAMRSGMRT